MKRAANLTVEGDLLDAAKGLGINLSETFEAALRRRVAEERAARWLAENAAAIQAFNAHLEEDGTFGEQVLDVER